MQKDKGGNRETSWKALAVSLRDDGVLNHSGRMVAVADEKQLDLIFLMVELMGFLDDWIWGIKKKIGTRII